MYKRSHIKITGEYRKALIKIERDPRADGDENIVNNLLFDRYIYMEYGFYYLDKKARTIRGIKNKLRYYEIKELW